MADTQLPSPLPQLDSLVRCDDERIALVDIAALNLVCASGLPGAEQLDAHDLLEKLDRWADEVKHQTQRNWHRFLATPADFENSAAYFSILVMITVLQRDLGVVYDPMRANDPKFQDPNCKHPDFRDSRNLFIHGILGGPGGTCSSMPVLYVAVGRRLGFPLKLVEAKDHCYCRWEDDPAGFQPERFNIEGTGQGLTVYPDSHYETWPRPLTDFDRKSGRYGKSLTPREELAAFLTTRGHCLLDNGRRQEAIQCFRWSTELAPQDKRYSRQLRSFLDPPYTKPYVPIRMVDRMPHDESLVIKVAHGERAPANMPSGARVQHVWPDEVEPYPGWVPSPGRVYKVALGRPFPTCLPPGTRIQWVPPHEADDFSAFGAVAMEDLPGAPFMTPGMRPPTPPQPASPAMIAQMLQTGARIGSNATGHCPVPGLPQY